jgi:hypothetical protein
LCWPTCIIHPDQTDALGKSHPRLLDDDSCQIGHHPFGGPTLERITWVVKYRFRNVQMRRCLFDCAYARSIGEACRLATGTAERCEALLSYQVKIRQKMRGEIAT